MYIVAADWIFTPERTLKGFKMVTKNILDIKYEKQIWIFTVIKKILTSALRVLVEDVCREENNIFNVINKDITKIFIRNIYIFKWLDNTYSLSTPYGRKHPFGR